MTAVDPRSRFAVQIVLCSNVPTVWQSLYRSGVAFILCLWGARALGPSAGAGCVLLSRQGWCCCPGISCAQAGCYLSGRTNVVACGCLGMWLWQEASGNLFDLV